MLGPSSFVCLCLSSALLSSSASDCFASGAAVCRCKAEQLAGGVVWRVGGQMWSLWALKPFGILSGKYGHSVYVESNVNVLVPGTVCDFFNSSVVVIVTFRVG